MQNISIKGVCKCIDLDRKIKLENGSIVIHKKDEKIIGVYLVISFRNNKNKYSEPTNAYCTLINLDNGKIAFEERCSRITTERRVLRHLTRMPYVSNSKEQDNIFKDMRIQVYKNGSYKIELDLEEEYIIA